MVPGVPEGGLGHHPVIQMLQGPEVISEVLHGLDVVLLLRGEDGVKGFQLNGEPGTGGEIPHQLRVLCDPKQVGAGRTHRVGRAAAKADEPAGHLPGAGVAAVSPLPANPEHSSSEGCTGLLESISDTNPFYKVPCQQL